MAQLPNEYKIQIGNGQLAINKKRHRHGVSTKLYSSPSYPTHPILSQFRTLSLYVNENCEAFAPQYICHFIGEKQQCLLLWWTLHSWAALTSVVTHLSSHVLIYQLNFFIRQRNGLKFLVCIGLHFIHLLFAIFITQVP